jgi:hypothetical protein
MLERIEYTISNVTLIQNELLYYQQLPNHFGIYPITDAFTVTSNKNELLLARMGLRRGERRTECITVEDRGEAALFV